MTQQPQTINEMWPSKWLRAIDLDKGKIVTITGQRIEMLRQYKSQETAAKLILTFKNGTKELIANKTQARAIAALTGSETFADWPGTKVLLKPKLLPNKKFTIEVCSVPDNGEEEAKKIANAKVADKILDEAFGSESPEEKPRSTVTPGQWSFIEELSEIEEEVASE